MPITHTFVSAIADAGEAGLLGPTEWNAVHTVPDHSELGSIGANDHHAQSHGNADHTSTFVTQTDIDSSITTHAGLADPHSVYRLESADHSHASSGLQGGTVSHANLTGVTADQHHNQSHGNADHTSTFVTQTEIDSSITTHAGLADPHTGYRLESADHSHQSTGAQAGQLDHGLALTGLTDDDHTQYALLAGRAGGQTLIGGTASGDDLTLQSTAHATRGTIFFGASAGFDEVNTRLGIGVTAPTASLNIRNDVNTSQIYLETSRAASGNSADLVADVYSGANANSGLVLRGRASRGTRGTEDYLDNNDTMARFSGVGWNEDNNDWGAGESGRVRIVADGDHAADSQPGKVVIETGLGQATPTIRLTVDNLGNTILGTAALATGATDGFLYIAGMAGAPSGTPTSYSGRYPVTWDSVNNLMKVYDGSWITVGSGSATTAGYQSMRVFEPAPGATETFIINSATYLNFSALRIDFDFDAAPMTHFRISGRGLTSEVAASVFFQLALSSTPTTALSAGGDDTSLTGNAAADFDSGWVEFAAAQSGHDRLTVAIRGSNGTVDLSLAYLHLQLKNEP